MSLLNVPYIGKKVDKTFLRTVSIQCTVAKIFKISLLNELKLSTVFPNIRPASIIGLQMRVLSAGFCPSGFIIFGQQKT